MKLATYLSQTGISVPAFAAKLGTSRQNVDRWCKGVTPRRNDLMRILAETEGQVTPNDFIFAPIAKPQPERLAS